MQAEQLFRQALGIQENALGPDHSEVAKTLSLLAFLLERSGEYNGAETLMKRAVAIDERALGSQHPATKELQGALDELRSKVNAQ
jgi:hypothetical protein